MLEQLTLKQASEGIRNKKFKPSELAAEMNDRAAKMNGDYNAYITLTPEVAMAAAKKADLRADKGELKSQLDGIPGSIKDIVNTKGILTTSASKILSNFVPPYNATVAEKLFEAGLVLTGKTNTDEFACGGSTEHSAYGVTRNPWDKSKVAGGSSGGAAAALAAGSCYYSIGTDTGGSIRLPASFCGVSGLKVTYGRVSRSGVTAMASSLDTVGGFAKTVEDLAILMEVIAGTDAKDSTTPNVAVPKYSTMLGGDIKGLKIGVPKEYFVDGLSPEVELAIRNAMREYEKMGAELVEISLPNTKYAVAIYYIIMPAEVSANLARYDGIRFGLKPDGQINELIDQYYKTRDQGFGQEVKRRILTGTYVLSAGYFDAFYRKAMKVRTLIKQDFENAFKKVDVIMTPVSPTVAFGVGEKNNDPLSMYLEDAFTIPASMAGVPGLSIPCGFSTSGLPIGLQILSPQFTEEKLLKVGHAYQLATDFHNKFPILV
ncbi:Asp-tRNA(Asn)/Glu-tRNA(Gln) amidotransferase subunit GatA [Candidatus Peregrinibacteria bacterium]|nr:Asp-tRNA(Asn)/Glu-tRNA(Gln) amidotransferase subunit GatA [Candidatus Peregrinibacteria bacterium]